MGQTNFCLAPQELLAFALVGLPLVNFDDGDHATIRFHNDRRRDAGLGWPALRCGGRFKDYSGVAFGDAGDGAFAQYDTVVFNELVHGLCKGLVRAKVGHDPLEWARAASVLHLGTLRKRPDPFAALTVLGLVDANVAKGGVPAEFFLPSLHSLSVCLSSCEVLMTWRSAQD